MSMVKKSALVASWSLWRHPACVLVMVGGMPPWSLWRHPACVFVSGRYAALEFVAASRLCLCKWAVCRLCFCMAECRLQAVCRQAVPRRGVRRYAATRCEAAYRRCASQQTWLRMCMAVAIFNSRACIGTFQPWGIPRNPRTA